MAAALENRIIDDVVTTLAAIDGTGDWHQAVEKVVRMSGNMIADIAVPGIAVLHDGAELQEERHDLDLYKLSLTLSMALSGDPLDWDTQLRDFASDCQAALMADDTRSGLAITTRCQSVQVFDAARGTLYVAAEMGVEIDYRVYPHNPTSNPYLT